MRLLITRPAGDAQAAADELRAKGHTVLACPLIEIEKASDQKLNLTAIQGFLVTDGDGARALAEAVGVRTFPVFCESAGTAAELTRLGFKDPRSADGDASTLARLIERSLNPKLGGLVYVCSNAAPINLSAMLNNMGFAVRMAALYDIKRADALPQLLTTALLDETLDAAVFFSADEARAFAQLVQRAELEAYTGRLIAIVAAPVVAAPLTVLKFARVVTAPKSDALSVMAMVDDTLLPQPEPEPIPEPVLTSEPEPAPVPEPEFVPEPVIVSTPEISGPEVSPPTPEIVEPDTFRSEVVALDEPQPESTPEPTQEIIDVPESEEAPPAPEIAPEETPQTEDAAPKKNRFAALGTFMQRFKPSAPAAASEVVTEAVPDAVAESAPLSTVPETVEEIPAQDDVRVDEETQVEMAPAPEAIPEPEPEPANELTPEPNAISEPVEEPALEAPVPEPIVSEPVEEPQATEDVTAILPPEPEPDHESESRRPPPRDSLFKKFAAFIARRQDEKEIPSGFAVQEPTAVHIDETPPAEPVRPDDAPETVEVLDITPDKISVPPEPEPIPEPEPEVEVAPEPEPAPEPVAADAAPEVIETAATENADTPAETDVVVPEIKAEEIAAPKPSLWAKASAFMGRLHATKRDTPEGPTSDGVTMRAEDEKSVAAVVDDNPPIPEILSPPEQNTEDQRSEPEPVIVIAADEPPAPTQVAVVVSAPESLEPELLEPEPIDVVVSPSEIEALTSQPAEAVDVPELTPEPDSSPAAISDVKHGPEAAGEIFEPEIFDQADEKNPPQETLLGTIPPTEPLPEDNPQDLAQKIPETTPPRTTIEPAAIQESVTTPMAAESNDISQDTSESAKPTIGSESGRGSRSGGRAARLLAEDAADARALNQRFKVGGAETPEPEPAATDADISDRASTTSAPRAAASSRGIPRFVSVVIVLGVLGAAAFYSASWITPQLENLSKTAQTQSPPASATPEQLTALQSRADTLAADVVALNARLNALEQRPVGAGTDAEAIKKITERLAALETSNTAAGAIDAQDGLGTSVTNQARQLANVTARVATLEAAIGNIAKLEDLATRLTSLEGKSAEANSVLALADRLAALEKRDAVAATALVLATAQLRDAVTSGKPYAMELETVSQLATRADVAFDTASLKEAAAKGLVRDDTLKNSFASVATQAVRAGVLPDTSAGWFRRALDRVYGIVSLRPFGSTEGTTPGAIVARAELALNNDNLPGAVAELETLTGASLEAIAPWLAQAKARVVADQALDDISARSVGAMSAVATPQSSVTPGSSTP